MARSGLRTFHPNFLARLRNFLRADRDTDTLFEFEPPFLRVALVVADLQVRSCRFCVGTHLPGRSAPLASIHSPSALPHQPIEAPNSVMLTCGVFSARQHLNSKAGVVHATRPVNYFVEKKQKIPAMNCRPRCLRIWIANSRPRVSEVRPWLDPSRGGALRLRPLILRDLFLGI